MVYLILIRGLSRSNCQDIVWNLTSWGHLFSLYGPNQGPVVNPNTLISRFYQCWDHQLIFFCPWSYWSISLCSVLALVVLILIWCLSRSSCQDIVWNLASRGHPFSLRGPNQGPVVNPNTPTFCFYQCWDHQLIAPAQEFCAWGFEKIPDFRIHPTDRALLSQGSPLKDDKLQCYFMPEFTILQATKAELEIDKILTNLE